MASYNFAIPDGEVSRVLDAFAYVYPIPQIEDPGNPGTFIPEFTRAQWAKKQMKEFVRRTVKRAEQKAAADAAKAGIVVDDSIITDN